MPRPTSPLPPLIQLIAKTLNPIAWKYLNHADDNASRKTKRTVSIRHARNVLKALRARVASLPSVDGEVVRAWHLVLHDALGEETNDPTL